MFVSIEEAAEYISMPVELVQKYVLEGRIKAIHDGENFLVNTAQFDTHLKQMEIVKQMIDEWRSEPIPEDIDVKDED
ncbi:excisionase family DNA-binding protein [Chungangia koreensis]|uniref:Excisionase family DNA-binding protein n=1 Tax=Chungangia koreensis TaxID=752657 RepID=A0ABV8X4H5_9LACT